MKNFIFAFGLAMFLISCGGNDTSKPAETSSTTEAPTQEEANEDQTNIPPPPEPKIAVSLVLNGSDQMQYDKKELKVEANSVVTLTLNHTGQLAKEAMGHNFVLLKAGTEITDFAMKALEAVATDYIPEGTQVIAHTKMLGGGDSDTITFDAPAKGTYDYICTFPGHYALMQGKFIVE